MTPATRRTLDALRRGAHLELNTASGWTLVENGTRTRVAGSVADALQRAGLVRRADNSSLAQSSRWALSGEEGA